MKYKSLWVFLGFTLFIVGFTAIVLSLVGTRYVFLGFLEVGGPLLAFGLKIIMILIGVLLVVLARTDWAREIKESSP